MSLHIIELVGPITLRYNFDAFTEKLGTLDKTDQLCFDFSRVGFVNPEALIVLVTASKLAFEKMQRPVLWDKLKPDVYSYLERVNIPSVRFVQLKKTKEAKKFYRSVRPSNNLVEFSIIKGWKEVGDAISKTKGVLNRWFPNKSIRYRTQMYGYQRESGVGTEGLGA